MTATPLDSCSGQAFVRPVRVYREDADAGGIVCYANHSPLSLQQELDIEH